MGLRLSGGGFGMHASGSEGRLGGTVFNSSLSRSTLTDLVGGKERGVGVSLLFAAALLVCMPGNREGERAGHLNLLRIPG